MCFICLMKVLHGMTLTVSTCTCQIRIEDLRAIVNSIVTVFQLQPICAASTGGHEQVCAAGGEAVALSGPETPQGTGEGVWLPSAPQGHVGRQPGGPAAISQEAQEPHLPSHPEDACW